MKKIQIINGPNLNLLGMREPHLYGEDTMDDILRMLRDGFPGVELRFFQSNVEGELVTAIQQAGQDADGIVLNAAAYSHTSVAIHDAIKAIQCFVVEVHLSNIYAREEYRHTSLISSACWGTISGFGKLSYQLAIEALLTVI